MNLNLEKLFYCPTHEWISIEQVGGETIGTVGITSFAVEQLTDLVFMALPKVGQTFAAGQEFGEVESVKAVSPVYLPVAGEIIEVNTPLVDQLTILNEDPYTKGWIVKIKVSDPSQTSALLSYADYQKQCSSGH
ncbi:MAG: glycine cleavage system protein GcvH [Planctomycetes bacterium]|jgi:glycine cleavage system H protein|nr:glycine cleavage system protein GcvH [Planctomycetota bacterium]